MFNYNKFIYIFSLLICLVASSAHASIIDNNFLSNIDRISDNSLRDVMMAINDKSDVVVSEFASVSSFTMNNKNMLGSDMLEFMSYNSYTSMQFHNNKKTLNITVENSLYAFNNDSFSSYLPDLESNYDADNYYTGNISGTNVGVNYTKEYSDGLMLGALISLVHNDYNMKYRLYVPKFDADDNNEWSYKNYMRKKDFQVHTNSMNVGAYFKKTVIGEKYLNYNLYSGINIGYISSSSYIYFVDAFSSVQVHDFHSYKYNFMMRLDVDSKDYETVIGDLSYYLRTIVDLQGLSNNVMKVEDYKYSSKPNYSMFSYTNEVGIKLLVINNVELDSNFLISWQKGSAFTLYKSRIGLGARVLL